MSASRYPTENSYISWWIWPHKPPASLFYILVFLLLSSTSLKLFVCVKVSDREIDTSAGGFGLTNRQLLSSNSVSFFYFLLLHQKFCLRQGFRLRHRDNYVSWWLWPHKPPASFFYFIEFLLLSSTSLKLFLCVKVSDREIATSAGGFGLTNRLLLSSTSLSFFYFLLLHQKFCLRQGFRLRHRDNYVSWWLWPHKPPASFFYFIEFLLLSSTSLKLFLCVKVSDREIATSAGGFGLTNRLLLSSTSLSFFYFLLLY